MNAYRNAIWKHFPNVPVVPDMSVTGSDAVYTRAAGIPTYGVGGAWGYIGDGPSGIHGLNERTSVSAFHGQIDIWEDMVRELAR